MSIIQINLVPHQTHQTTCVIVRINYLQRVCDGDTKGPSLLIAIIRRCKTVQMEDSAYTTLLVVESQTRQSCSGRERAAFFVVERFFYLSWNIPTVINIRWNKIPGGFIQDRRGWDVICFWVVWILNVVEEMFFIVGFLLQCRGQFLSWEGQQRMENKGREKGREREREIERERESDKTVKCRNHFRIFEHNLSANSGVTTRTFMLQGQ